MKTLLIVYHDLYYEVRSEELLKLLKLYGEVVLVSYANYNDAKVKCICNPKGEKGILTFLRNSLHAIKVEKPDMILLHDDYPMILVPYIKHHLPESIIIHDSSELRLINEKKDGSGIKSVVAKYFRYFEKWYTKKVDVVIAANDERAEIMKEYCDLKRKPIVYGNIHKIECEYDADECEKKFEGYFDDSSFVALYAGGIAEKRLTYTMVRQIGALSENYKLLIVGSVENGGEAKLEHIISNNNIKNVFYLGFVTRAELKYLFEKSHVSISAFAFDTVNNINCASGKAYEGLFLGKPLLAGINPPLKRMCEVYGIGESTEDFAAGLQKLEERYDDYIRNVEEYIKKIDFDNRIANLKIEIDNVLHNKSG